MCGIAGIISFNLNKSRKTVKGMTDSLAHRGPDDSGYWDNNYNIVFGHRRLSIQDTSNAGHQPMHSHCGRYTVIYNGEIYNFIQLREDLNKSHKIAFKGGSDTEVLLALFQKYGIEATIPMLEGMFSIATYDSEDKALYLIRDRVGEKPLFYAYVNNELFFSSELKSFKKTKCVDLSVDPEAVSLYLSSTYIPTPKTIYKNINKLSPASILKVSTDTNTLSIQNYWSAGETQINISSNYSDAVNQLNALIIDSVAKQQIADVNLGCFLSGGIDSSLITAVAQSLSDTPIDTFTIGFDQKEFNEAEHARKVADHLGTSHHEFIVTEKEALDIVPNLMNIYDEPFSDSSSIPTLLLTGKTRQHVTVALSGDGGDELFNGYTRHHSSVKRYNLLKKLPFKSSLSSVISSQLIRKLVTNSDYLKENNIIALAHYFEKGDFSTFYALVSSHLKMNQEVVSQLFYTPKMEINDDNLYKAMSLIDISGCLSGDMLCKVDRASMYSSLETRIPLLSHHIIDFALSLPTSFKVKDAQGKQVLRDVLYQYVPQSLIERPKKGFSIPLYLWLQTILKEPVMDAINSNRHGLEQYISSRWIEAVINGFYKDKKMYHYYLWDIYILALWFESN